MFRWVIKATLMSGRAEFLESVIFKEFQLRIQNPAPAAAGSCRKTICALFVEIVLASPLADCRDF